MKKDNGRILSAVNPHFVKKLDNGVTLLLYPRVECLTAAFGVFHGVGAANESVRRREQGIAHVIEHMMFKSTEFRTTKQLGDAFSAIGAETNAYTDWDSTVYYARVPHQNLRKLIALIGEMVRHPMFKDSELKTEKGAIVSEIRRSEDAHDRRTIEIARGNLFAPTSRQRGSIIGIERDVVGMNGDDLQRWKDRLYTAGNTVIVAVGRFEPGEVIEQVGEIWGDMPKSGRTKVSFATVDGGSDETVRRDTQQAHVSQVSQREIAWNSPEAYAQALMMHIYGGGMSSRLFREIREKRGLSYSCSAWSTWNGISNNVFTTTYVGTSEKDLQRVRDLIDSIQDGLAGKHVGKAELDRARNECIGQMMITHDSLINFLRYVGEYYVQTRSDTDVERFANGINSVTALQVLEAAELTFRKTGISTAVCLPNENK